jgi:uncharacterized membrane protein
MPETITPSSDNERSLAWIIYILYACLFCAVIPVIVAIIINYVKKDDLTDPIAADHFKWQRRTFWFGLLWSCICFVLCFVFIGYLGFLIVGIWWIYRLVKGMLRLYDGKRMYLEG